MFTGASQAFPSLVNPIAHCLWSCSQLMSSRKQASPSSTVPVCFWSVQSQARRCRTEPWGPDGEAGQSTCILTVGRPSWRRDRLTPALQRTRTAPQGGTAGRHSCRADHVSHAPAAQGRMPRKRKLPTAASGSCLTQKQFPLRT